MPTIESHDYDMPLLQFSVTELERLLRVFEATVQPRLASLATNLRAEVIKTNPPALKKKTRQQLSKWCKTDYQYGEGGDVARKISELIFGRVIDRDALGV